jgi:hypothetical protein
MRLLVFAPRLGSQPWSVGPLAAALASALTARGHRLVLAADSVDDPAMFTACERVVTFRTYSQTSTDFPAGFGRWCAAQRSALRHDAALSLARSAAADVSWPLDPTPLVWLRHHAATKSPLGLGALLVKHRAVARALAGGRGPRPARLFTDGPGPHLTAARRLGLHPEDPRLVMLPRFCLLEPIAPGEREACRDAVRGMLRIAPGSLVFVLSVPESIGRRLDAPLRGLAMTGSGGRAHGPILIALARDTFTLRAAVARAGGGELLDRVRIVTPTADPRPPLLATDYALAPFASAYGHGQFVSDALWMGTPVIALAAAAGAELILPPATLTPAPGLLVRRDAAPDWAEALTHAASPATLARAAAAVDRAALAISFAEAVATIEGALEAAQKGKTAGDSRRSPTNNPPP